MPSSFLLVRHAESLWNAAGRWQGHGDPPLSARGVAQAEALAQRLGDQGADALWSSDLRRARQTAGILGRALGLEPRDDPRLRELDVGAWCGLTRPEIEARDGEALARFDAGDEHLAAGGGESRAALARRVHAAFDALAEQHAGGRVVVVTHLGVVRALLPGVELANAEAISVAREPLGPGAASGEGVAEAAGSPRASGGAARVRWRSGPVSSSR